MDLSSATKPSHGEAVDKLLSDVVTGVEHLHTSEKPLESLASRLDLLAKVRKLERGLQTPREMMIQQLWAQPANAMAISFGVTTGLWTAMASNGDGPQKVTDLAKQLGLQEELLRRIMRHISASGCIDMTAPDEYTPNVFTRSIAHPVMSAGYSVCPPILNPLFLKGPDWLKSRGSCPTQGRDTTYQAAHNTDLSWFEHLQQNPRLGRHFNDHMFGYLLGRPAWIDLYPVQERMIDGFDTEDKDAVMLIDIAGGIGHYTEQYRTRFPDGPGRLVVQDLAPVLEQATALDPSIEKMPVDFFTEQPLKGARVYFTHFILHDWPDEDCVRIANRIKEAMKPGYSKFLVHEHVIPEMGQDSEQTALDLIMMTGFGSKERSASQWTNLLEEQAGLKIVKIWPGVNGMESVIECERQD